MLTRFAKVRSGFIISITNGYLWLILVLQKDHNSNKKILFHFVDQKIEVIENSFSLQIANCLSIKSSHTCNAKT